MNFRDVLAWLYPNHCLICGKYIKANLFVCSGCLPKEKIERCFNINGKNPHFLKAYSPANYKDNYRLVVDKFKFSRKSALARRLGFFTFMVLDKNEFKDYDIITFVPMTKRAVAQRGYNQAQLYAKQVANQLGLALICTLQKAKITGVQHRLSAKDRQKNIKGAFKAIKDIKGQKIILVDDIITTGATAQECAKILYKAGAEKVVVICAANTPLPTTPPGDE